MLVPVVAILLGCAILIRAVDTGLSGSGRLGQLLLAMAACLGIGLVLVSGNGNFPALPTDPGHDDGLTRGCLMIGLVSCLLLSLLESRSVLLAAAAWNTGLLALAAGSQQPVLGGIAVLGIGLAPLLSMLLFRQPAQDFAQPEGRSFRSWKRPVLPLAGLLFCAGLWLHLPDSPNPLIDSTGVILLLAGLGGLLGWFPFPRVNFPGMEGESLSAVVAWRLLPVLCAGGFLWRWIEFRPLSTSSEFLLIIAALFSGIFSAARLTREDDLIRRGSLSTLLMFSFLLLALAIQNWELSHQSRNWTDSSVLPTGRQLFLIIGLCESAGLWLILCGARLLQPVPTATLPVRSLAGAAVQDPLRSLPMLLGVLIQAGFPPGPGFWWRMGLILVCLLPHRQSSVTQVIEGDNSYSLTALAMTLLVIVSGLGHLKIAQILCFEEPFRVRPASIGWTSGTVAVVLILFVALLSCAPLTMGSFLFSSEVTPQALP